VGQQVGWLWGHGGLRGRSRAGEWGRVVLGLGLATAQCQRQLEFVVRMYLRPVAGGGCRRTLILPFTTCASSHLPSIAPAPFPPNTVSLSSPFLNMNPCHPPPLNHTTGVLPPAGGCP
jgi:hypothetical protein